MRSTALFVGAFSRNSLRGCGSLLLDSLHSVAHSLPPVRVWYISVFGTGASALRFRAVGRVVVLLTGIRLPFSAPAQIAEGILRTSTYLRLIPLLPRPGQHPLFWVGGEIPPSQFRVKSLLIGMDYAVRNRAHRANKSYSPGSSRPRDASCDF